MSEVVNIVLPEGVSDEDAREIEALLKEVEGIEDAGSVSTRSLTDPASVTMWIEVAAGILGLQRPRSFLVEQQIIRIAVGIITVRQQTVTFFTQAGDGELAIGIGGKRADGVLLTRIRLLIFIVVRVGDDEIDFTARKV